MDNNNGNRQIPDSQLSEENRKWLDELVKKSQAETTINTEEETTQTAEVIDPQDEELEKILAEDWLNMQDVEETKVLKADIMEQSADTEVAPALEETSLRPGRVKKIIPQKGRPKRKDGYGLWGIPHILSTVIWLILIVAIGVSLGKVLWVCCADVMAFGKEAQKVTITITEDDTIKTISKKLGQANLIRYPGLFQFFAEVTGKDENISAGTFTLNSQLDYNAMINAMVSYGSAREEVDIMFPEGYNCAQIFKLLEKNNVCSVAELEEYAANGELSDYWFLEGVKRGDKYSLEGYLAPDTYTFYTNDEPRRVLEKFLNEFDSRFTDIMKENFESMQKQFATMLRNSGFSSAYIEENALTLHQVVTLASVIEKETSSNGESYDIASVFYNRLANPSILSLGADATVYYAVGDYFGEIGELTAEHLAVDSPYNTRKSKGIPPGPICNMGVHSLYAALEPNDTDYHYFVFDSEKGAHRFAVTQSEHLQNVAELMG